MTPTPKAGRRRRAPAEPPVAAAAAGRPSPDGFHDGSSGGARGSPRRQRPSPRVHPRPAITLLLLALLGAATAASVAGLVEGGRSPHAHPCSARCTTEAPPRRTARPGWLPRVRGGAQDEETSVSVDDAPTAVGDGAPTIAETLASPVAVVEEATTTTPAVGAEASESDDEPESQTTASEPGQQASDNDGDSDDDDDEAPDEASATTPVHPALSNQLVPVNITTGLGRGVLLEQSVEMTVLRSRSVANLKENLRRMMPGRPPVALLRLRLGPRVLADDLLVDELLDDDEDEEDEEEEDESSTDGGRARLTLVLDMIPPVDPKMVLLPESQLDDLTPSQLLDAYATNEAALYQNAAMMLEEDEDGIDDNGTKATGKSEGQEAELTESAASKPQLSVSVTAALKERATRIRRDMESTLLVSASAQAVLAEAIPPSHKAMNLQEREVRGQRVRQVAQGGVKTTLKRKIQRNFNVNWPETLRQICLFLFFGYFGGRSPMSRAILLLGAPSVILFQARHVKVWLRRIIYMIFFHPPLIFLSLLPAPQQSLLSVNVDDVMATVYGEYYQPSRADRSRIGTDDTDEVDSADGTSEDSEDSEE